MDQSHSREPPPLHLPDLSLTNPLTDHHLSSELLLLLPAGPGHRRHGECRSGEEGEGGGGVPARAPLFAVHARRGAGGHRRPDPDLLLLPEEGHLPGHEGHGVLGDRHGRGRRVQPASNLRRGGEVHRRRPRPAPEPCPGMVRLLVRPGASVRGAGGGRGGAAGLRHRQAGTARAAVDGDLQHVRRLLQAGRRGHRQRRRGCRRRRPPRVPVRLQPLQALRR